MYSMLTLMTYSSRAQMTPVDKCSLKVFFKHEFRFCLTFYSYTVAVFMYFELLKYCEN